MSGEEAVMNEALWCVIYGVMWWWVFLLLPDAVR